MGRIYLEHLGGSKLFSCAECDTFISNREELFSSRFLASTERAYSFNKVVNVTYMTVKNPQKHKLPETIYYLQTIQEKVKNISYAMSSAKFVLQN